MLCYLIHICIHYKLERFSLWNIFEMSHLDISAFTYFIRSWIPNSSHNSKRVRNPSYVDSSSQYLLSVCKKIKLVRSSYAIMYSQNRAAHTHTLAQIKRPSTNTHNVSQHTYVHTQQFWVEVWVLPCFFLLEWLSPCPMSTLILTMAT